MRWPDTLRLRLRSLFQRARVDDELYREVRFHFDQQIEENVAAGMTPEDARPAALRTFGNPTRHPGAVPRRASASSIRRRWWRTSRR